MRISDCGLGDRLNTALLSSFINPHSAFRSRLTRSRFRLSSAGVWLHNPQLQARAKRMATQITETGTAATTNVERREVISYDPATGAEVGRAPLASADDVARAVARAREAQKGWAALSFRERGAVVMRARSLVLEELEEIAPLVSRESGKPSAEAVSMEIVPALDLMQFFARKTARMLRPERISIGLYN